MVYLPRSCFEDPIQPHGFGILGYYSSKFQHVPHKAIINLFILVCGSFHQCMLTLPPRCLGWEFGEIESMSPTTIQLHGFSSFQLGHLVFWSTTISSLHHSYSNWVWLNPINVANSIKTLSSKANISPKTIVAHEECVIYGLICGHLSLNQIKFAFAYVFIHNFLIYYPRTQERGYDDVMPF